MDALLFALGRFLAAFCASCCVGGRFRLVFVHVWSFRARFWRVRGRFWRSQSLVFRGFSVPVRLQCEPSPRGVSYGKNQYETHVGHLARAKKNGKNRACSLLNRALCYERPKLRSWRAPKSILVRFWRLPGVSWAALGHFWPALGRSWATVGRVWGASLAFFDAPWLPSAVQDGLGLDFSSILVRFWLHFGGVELGFCRQALDLRDALVPAIMRL